MYLTRYGTQFGNRTVRHGRTIYVAPSAQYSGIVSNITGAGGTTGTFAASDNNDGLSPERAVRTVTYAVNTLAVAGDTVILLPGTHTTTAVLSPRAGVTIFGSGGEEGRASMYETETSLTTSGSNHLWNLATSNVEIAYLRMYPITGFSTVSFQTAVSGSQASGTTVTGLYIHDCMIDLTAAAASGVLTAGIDFRKRAAAAGQDYATSTATVYGMIENCYFPSLGAQGPGIATATCSIHVRGCRFHNAMPGTTWASPFLVATNTQGSVIENCLWTTVGTGIFGNAINGSGTSAVMPLYALSIINCRFPASGQMDSSASGPVDAFSTALTATITESYSAGSGTAVTAIN